MIAIHNRLTIAARQPFAIIRPLQQACLANTVQSHCPTCKLTVPLSLTTITSAFLTTESTGLFCGRALPNLLPTHCALVHDHSDIRIPQSRHLISYQVSQCSRLLPDDLQLTMPLSMTTVTSAFLTVDNRCAITITVRSRAAMAASNALCTWASLSASCVGFAEANQCKGFLML